MTLSLFVPNLFLMSSKDPRQNGLAIRWFRIKAGRKPGEFAEAVGISYSSLDNIENERRSAGIEVLHRIAVELDVPVGAVSRSSLVRDAA